MSAPDPQNLGTIAGVREALARVPGGVESARLMDKLGLWTAPAHRQVAQRKPFRTNFSDLAPDQLSNLSAEWVSESGRVIELVGLLSGMEVQLKVRGKSARAAARAKARREWDTDRKAPTKAELDDLAEEDDTVKEIDDQLSLVQLLLAQAAAVKEANQLYKEAISREITYRVAQLNARMY